MVAMNYLHTKPPKCISNVATVAKQKVQMRFAFHCEPERSLLPVIGHQWIYLMVVKTSQALAQTY